MKSSIIHQPLFMSRVNRVDRLLFTKHLAVMIKSGIPLAEAIATLSQETPNQYLGKILADVSKALENGQPLHQSLAKYPKLFNSISLNIIRIGEESGTLEQNLDFLAEQLQRGYETRRKIEGALLYPELILMTALVVSSGVSFFVLPKLGDLFRELDTTLPLTTKILLFMSDYTRDYGLITLLSTIVSILIMRWFLNTLPMRPRWHSFQLSFPIFGRLMRNYELTSFFRNLGIMLRSGLPIISALDALGENSQNYVFREYIRRIKSEIERGQSMESTLEKYNFQYFPLLATKMIGVGERSGRLDESLLYLADFFEDEAEDTAKNFTNILEPVMLLVVGLVVAFIALSIISPIYQLSGSIRPR